MNPSQNLQDEPARRRRRRHSSHSDDRGFRYRRKALWRIVAGLFGILMGISFAIVPVGVSGDRNNILVVGIFIFLAGYIGVMAGCRWWVKAKGWPEALIAIGLAPIVIIFIPWVRLIFVAAPLLLPFSMAFMPLVLIVVVLVLPDKSAPNRNHWNRY